MAQRSTRDRSFDDTRLPTRDRFRKMDARHFRRSILAAYAAARFRDTRVRSSETMGRALSSRGGYGRAPSTTRCVRARAERASLRRGQAPSRDWTNGALGPDGRGARTRPVTVRQRRFRSHLRSGLPLPQQRVLSLEADPARGTMLSSSSSRPASVRSSDVERRVARAAPAAVSGRAPRAGEAGDRWHQRVGAQLPRQRPSASIRQAGSAGLFRQITEQRSSASNTAVH